MKRVYSYVYMNTFVQYATIAVCGKMLFILSPSTKIKKRNVNSSRETQNQGLEQLKNKLYFVVNKRRYKQTCSVYTEKNQRQTKPNRDLKYTPHR